MTVEPKAALMAFLTPTGEQIGDAAPVYAFAFKACVGQQTLQQNQRATLYRCDRWATDQLGGQLDGICHERPHFLGLAWVHAQIQRIGRIANPNAAEFDRNSAAIPLWDPNKTTQLTLRRSCRAY
jgi:hypothetical protein